MMNEQTYKADLSIIKWFVGILTGCIFLLSLGISKVENVTFFETFFTSISALSCTGLSLFKVSDTYTIFGQIVLLLTIQVGGIGILTLMSWIAVTTGKSITRKEKIVFSEMFSVGKNGKFNYYLKRVVRYTFSIELIGASLLAISFVPEYGLINGVYYSVFHSISAFCNAGFDVFPNTYEILSNNWVQIVTMGLIIAGGLGFVTLINIKSVVFKGTEVGFKKLSQITKMILIWSFMLIIGGALLIFVAESGNVSIIDSLFLSVSSRTAGFANFDLINLTSASKYIVITLMLIGGATGSTAGGIHINNFTTLINYRRNELILKRKAIKSVLIIALSIGILFIAYILVSMFNGAFNLDQLFHVASAFATVGLSTIDGATMSRVSLFIVCILMFLGKLSLSLCIYTLLYGHKTKESEIGICYNQEKVVEE